MSREEFLYLLPYFFPLLLMLGIFVYTWRHRYIRGARVYSWFVAGQAITVIGFLLELISPDIQTKILWDKFQWVTDSVLVVLPFLIFSIQFSEKKLKRPFITWGFWGGLLVLFFGVLLTDNIHHLIYSDPTLTASKPFSDLRYDFTIVVYVYTLVYIYGSTLYGVSILLSRALKSQQYYRMQYLTIAIGFSIPITLSILTLTGITITQQRDLSPFSFATGNLVVAWGLFRYGLFDIIPIARERIMEGVLDPVFVLDNYNRILDINPAAIASLGIKNRIVIGQSLEDIANKWPVLIDAVNIQNSEHTEIAVKEEDDTFFFDLNISSVRNSNGELIGKVVVARDITRYKTLEAGYRILSAELEQRINERTEELRQTAERYRAVVENQMEFIVRWRPDGVRTFANEAYCDYFLIPIDQALTSTFLPLIHKDDRDKVKEKMARLVSGETKVETDIHRVIKPNGEIGWHEWTDQAIYDESGNLIEFQAVGRDITQRHLAEEHILRLNRLYVTISQINKTIVYVRDKNELFKEICNVVIEYGKFRMAWVGLLDQTTGAIKPVVFAGDEQGYLTKIKVVHHDQKLGKGPTSKAVQEGQCVICQDIANDPIMAPWREYALPRGFLSSAAVPLRENGKIIGTLSVYAGTVNEFNTENKELLEQIGQDVSFAIDSITHETERLHAEARLEDAYDTTLEGWAKALELRDKETEGHSRRVTETTVTIARAMGIPDKELEHIRRGSILHDIGKMGIPDDILRKNGPLTDDERAIVVKHPTTAYELLKPIAYLEKALEIPYCHHEKWDGTGYPRSLKGEEIPLSARIFAIVDVWDALSSDRPYRNAWPQKKVIEYLKNDSGKHFDPNVLEVFLQMVEKGEI